VQKEVLFYRFKLIQDTLLLGLITQIIPILVRNFQNGTHFELGLNLVPNFNYCINVVPSVKYSQTPLTTLPRVSLWIFKFF